MTDDQPWLSPDQQRAWRHWIALGTALPTALNRQLQEDSGLSLSDYDVLVALTEAPDDRLRVGELSAGLGWERSRCSHHVRRMAGRGLVERHEDAEDGRGAWVVVTAAGRTATDRAAPGHARLVRDLVFADLSPADVAALERALGAVVRRLGAE